MAKETKLDRLVRNMFDQVSEHLHELKAIVGSGTSKESDVERWCQSFLKSCLGYSATQGYTIKAQETRGKMRPDLIVCKGEKPVLIVEVKKYDFDLNKSDFRSGKTQLAEYLNSIGGVRWGMLSNGSEWRLYDFSQPQFGAIEIASVEIKGEDDQIAVGKKDIEDLCYDFSTFTESAFSSDEWNELTQEATAFSPDSLAKALLSAEVTKQVSKIIRSEFGYKANAEILGDKIYDVLTKGLNEAIVDWNEVKQAELSKYLKSQKRAGRKKRRAAKTDGSAPQLDQVKNADQPLENSTSNSVPTSTKKAA